MIRSKDIPNTRNRQDFDSSIDVTPLEESKNDNSNELFYLDTVGEEVPLEPVCPETLKEMMVIVHDIRQQRADMLGNLQYATPKTAVNHSNENTPSRKSRSNNYDAFVVD